MLLKELSKIAAQSGNCRLVISYNGDDKYALGVSDGVTTPLVVNGTLVELQTAIAEKLPGYLELAVKEAAEKKAKEEAARHKRNSKPRKPNSDRKPPPAKSLKRRRSKKTKPLKGNCPFSENKHGGFNHA